MQTCGSRVHENTAVFYKSEISLPFSWSSIFISLVISGYFPSLLHSCLPLNCFCLDLGLGLKGCASLFYCIYSNVLPDWTCFIFKIFFPQTIYAFKKIFLQAVCLFSVLAQEAYDLGDNLTEALFLVLKGAITLRLLEILRGITSQWKNRALWRKDVTFDGRSWQLKLALDKQRSKLTMLK